MAQTKTSFMVPDIVELINQLKDKKVIFRSQREITETLIPKMDQIHADFMDE